MAAFVFSLLRINFTGKTHVFLLFVYYNQGLFMCLPIDVNMEIVKKNLGLLQQLRL